MKNNKNIILAILGVMAVSLTAFALYDASDYYNADGSFYNLGADNIAVSGYDLIEYHQHNVAVEGDNLFAAEHDGVNYHFLNASNRDLFSQSPEQYLPAYGGYCAFGLGMEVGDGLGDNKPGKYPANPESFKLINDKLYLFYDSPGIHAIDLWNKNQQALLQKANARWQLIGNPKL